MVGVGSGMAILDMSQTSVAVRNEAKFTLNSVLNY